MGRPARSSLARRGDPGHAAVRLVDAALQRHARPHRRRRPAVCAAIPRVRRRPRDRRRANVCRVLVAPARLGICRRGRQRSHAAARDRRGVRAPGVGGLPIAARRRPGRVGRRARRPASAGRPRARRRSAARQHVRAGAHDRVSHSLPAVRGSPRPRSAVASRLPRELQRRGAALGGRAAADGGGAVGRASSDRPAGAHRLPRRRSAGDAVQRPSIRAGEDSARRTSRPGR